MLLRRQLLSAAAAVLRFWADGVRKRAWRCWRQRHEVLTSFASAAVKRPLNLCKSKLRRHVAAWCEQVPMWRAMQALELGSTGRGEAILLAEKMTSACMQAWARRTREQVWSRFTSMQSQLFRRKRMFAHAIYAWVLFVHNSCRKWLATKLGIISRVQRSFRRWLSIVHSVRFRNDSNIRAAAELRVRRAFQDWQYSMESRRRRLRQSDLYFKQNIARSIISGWKSVGNHMVALRALDNIAVHLGLKRLARYAVESWAMWYQRRLTICGQRVAVDKHRSHQLLKVMWRHWAAFIRYRQTRYHCFRRARVYCRTRSLRFALHRWLRFIERTNSNYIALRSALSLRRRAIAHWMFSSWLFTHKRKSVRRLALLHANGHRERALTHAAIKLWRNLTRSQRHKVYLKGVAVASNNARIKLHVFKLLLHCVQSRLALRWARTERLRWLRLQLNRGQLCRVWIGWFQRIERTRLKVSSLQWACEHRLVFAFAAIVNFLEICRESKRRLSKARCFRCCYRLKSLFYAWRTVWFNACLNRRMILTADHHYRLASFRACWCILSAYVQKRRSKHDAKKLAVTEFRRRLLRHGCRNWLQSGVDQRAFRLNAALDAEGLRAKSVLRIVERVARRWRAKALAQRAVLHQENQPHTSACTVVSVHHASARSHLVLTRNTTYPLVSSPVPSPRQRPRPRLSGIAKPCFHDVPAAPDTRHKYGDASLREMYEKLESMEKSLCEFRELRDQHAQVAKSLREVEIKEGSKISVHCDFTRAHTLML